MRTKRACFYSALVSLAFALSMLLYHTLRTDAKHAQIEELVRTTCSIEQGK